MRRFSILIAALLFTLYSFAGVEPFTNSIRGGLKKGDSLVVKDEKFRLPSFDWNTIQKQKVKNSVTLQVFQDTNAILPNAFSAEVKLKIAYYAHPDQAEPLYVNNVQLKVKFNKDSLLTSKLIDIYDFENGHWVKVTIEDITSDGNNGTVPPFLQLTSQVIVDRQYLFDPTRPLRASFTFPETVTGPAAFSARLVSQPTPDEVLVTLPITGVDEFDIEWTTLDRNAGYEDLINSLVNNQTVPVATLNELFRSNATRVTTHKADYTVNVNHYNSFLFFRVRGVQYQDGIRNEGDWDYKNEDGSFALINISSRWHQPDLNWQYTATYAEEGKKKEVVSYFDGSLRSRQTVTVNNEDKKAVVQESVYDQYGRAVASILPAPVNAAALAYYKRLHLNATGQVYSAADVFPTAGCERAPLSLASTDPNNPAAILGAGQYYSPSNAFINNKPAYKYIPDAEGFPLAITRYTPDNTGRIKWQGGVGKVFQPSSADSRTTKYYYGKPEQEELDKLFGSEVGYAEHYLKNLVVDANGQVSLSYLDASGKTIATALAGETPASLENLPGKPAKKQETRKLIKPQQFQYDYTNLTLSATTTYLAEVAGSATLSFDVEKLVYKYAKSGWEICSNCYYDLTMNVYDDCNNVVYTTTATEKIGTETPDCNNWGVFTKEVALNFNKIGEYKIGFQLALSRKVVESYTEKYIEERKQRKDWKTEYQFIEDYAKLQDFNSCFDDCATCEEELGTRAAFIANGQAQLSVRGISKDAAEAAAYTTWLDNLYTTLSNQCQALKVSCDYSPCSRYEKLMLEDVSPFGQFAPFKTTGADISTLEVVEPEINVLYKHWRTVFSVAQPGSSDYEKDAFEDDNGNHTSPRDASFTLAMLVKYWKPEWASKFLTYHPENCKLDFCKANAQFINWDNQVQNEIHTAAAITSHRATLNATYSYSNPSWLVDQDPFFRSGNAGQAYAADMRADLQQFSTRVLKNTSLSNKNLTQFVDYMLYCVNPEGNTNAGIPADNWTNCSPAENCRIKNREWENYKDWYFQLKEKYYDLVRNNTTCAGACEVGTPIALPSASTCPQKTEFSIVSGGDLEAICATDKKAVRIVFNGSNNRTFTVALQYAAPYSSWGLPASVTINQGQTAAMICISKDVPLTAIYITGVTCSGTPPAVAPCPFGNGGTLNLPTGYQRSGNSFSYFDAAYTYTYTIVNGKPGEVPSAAQYCPAGAVERNFYNCYTIQPAGGAMPMYYYNVWVIKCTVDRCANATELTGMTQVTANKFLKNGEYYYINTAAECASPVTVYSNLPCLKVYLNGIDGPLYFYNATVYKCDVCSVEPDASIYVTQHLGGNIYKDASGNSYEIIPNTTSGQVMTSGLCASPVRNWYSCVRLNLNGSVSDLKNVTVFFCPSNDPCQNALYITPQGSDYNNMFYSEIISGCYRYRTSYYIFSGFGPETPPTGLSNCYQQGDWAYYECIKFELNGTLYTYEDVWVETCYQSWNNCGGGGGGGGGNCDLPQGFREASVSNSVNLVEPCEVYLQTQTEKEKTDRYYTDYKKKTLYIVRKDKQKGKSHLVRREPKKLTHFTRWQYKEQVYLQTDSATYVNLQNVWVASYSPQTKEKLSKTTVSMNSLAACPAPADFHYESNIIQDDYYSSGQSEQRYFEQEVYYVHNNGPVTRPVNIRVRYEHRFVCPGCEPSVSYATFTLEPGQQSILLGNEIERYSTDYGNYTNYESSILYVVSDGITCPAYEEPCTMPQLLSVTPVGGTSLELAFTNVSSSTTDLTVQSSSDNVAWTSHSGPLNSPRTLSVANASGTWYFRVVANCGGAPYTSNVYSYTFPSTCPAVYQYKQPRFVSVNYNTPTIDPTTEVNNGMAQLQQQIQTSCEGQAEQWLASLQEGLAAKQLSDGEITTIRQRLIAVCTAGGDLDHPNGASTVRPNTTATYNSFKAVLQSSLTEFGKGGFDMTFNPWLLESPYPWDNKPQAVEQTLSSTSPALCDKLTQLQQQYNANTGGVTFYTYLVNRFGPAMSITEAQLNTLLKGCTNCKYLLDQDIPLPVFLEPGAKGCITKSEWDAAHTAFAGEFPAGVMDPAHENYGNILSNYLNHRWGFTLTYDKYRAYGVTLAGDAAAILCNQPVYSPVTLAPYQCFNSIMATVITNGQRDYEAYVEQEKKIFRTNYVATCLTVQPNVRLTAWQQSYHYTLYYYDQAGNLVKTVPPAGVNLLNEAQVARVDNNRKFDLVNCTFDGPTQDTDKSAALNKLSTTLEATGNRSLEYWLYNGSTGANQFLATTPDKKFMYHSCLNGQYLSIDIYKLEQTAADQIDFVHSNHLTVDVSTLQPLPGWTHVVVQGGNLSTGLLQVFVNGTLRNAVAGDPPAGCGWEVTAANPVIMPENLGTLKQLRFYDRMLNSAEIAANAGQPCMGLSGAYLSALNQSLLHWGRFGTPPAGGTGTVGGTTTETQVEPVYPAHNKVTTYQYNSMGQVVTQTTPDAGRSNFWYDRLGRLTASQNAEQLAPARSGDVANRYSYTKYDHLGRIAEVGEKEGAAVLPSPGFITEVQKNNFLWVGTNKQVTVTDYDNVLTNNGVIIGLPQTNLRKRVAASYYKPLGNGPVEAASYYSYDAAGNVNTLWQQVPGAGLKKIDYQYDLVSGKVNAVLYQHGQPDAFYYQYSYDAENRLTAVYSNTQGYLTGRGLLDIRPLSGTHRDAEYSYYLHGPLMRMELGQNKVQGVDYAYTLQGWLKGINGQKLDPANDMGLDNWVDASNDMRTNARDVLGFSLGYYQGDFKPIGGTGSAAFGMNYTSQPGDVTGKPLFNGNISNTTLALSKFRNGDPVGYSYGYDQLNRLKEMRQHGLSAATATWNNASAGDPYRESYSYDADGNILSLLRNGTTEGGKPLPMDQLSYNYIPNSNKLAHVSDAIGDGNYSEDIDNQLAGNYRYDKIGNLIGDVGEGITDIQWTVYGKIGSLTKANGTTISYNYDAAGNRIRKDVTTGGVTTTTHYLRDAQGIPLAVYEGGVKKEQHLYGSSRLGMYDGAASQRSYELTNHLGNVLATVSEHKLNTGAAIEADVLSQQDYYAFGMGMPQRKWGSSYRYGFNGKELDTDGDVVQYDYGFRIYDPRLARFKSIDPLFKSFPWYTPFQFAGNMPIWAIDLDGLEEMKANSVAHVIKDINGNIITKPTIIRSSNSYDKSIPGVKQLDGAHIEVTPGLLDKDHPYWNTFTWQQKNGSDFTCIQSITPIGQDAGGTIKPPKTHLVQDNDDVPVTGIKARTTTAITPTSSSQVSNQSITRSINFVSGEPQFRTDADRQIVNQVANSAPNRTINGAPVTKANGNVTTTTRTNVRIRSVIRIDLKTDLSNGPYGQNLLDNRYNLLRQQLINAGVPASNIMRGSTEFNSEEAAETTSGNQIIFNVNTTTTRRTTGTRTTTTIQ